MIHEARAKKGDLTVVWLDLANAYGSIPHKTALTYYLSCSFPVAQLGFPVAQLVEHGANNAKIMGLIPRESKSWSNVKL